MKADLHVHTSYSPDSKAKPEDVVRAAKERGIGCIAITDHNSFKAYFDVRDSTDVIVIPAEEVSSKDGHILAFGIDKEIPSGLSIIDTINAIHEANGIAIAAHPYRWWSGLGEKNVVPEFDGVESLNARSTFGANRKSRALAKRFGKIETAGSDAHITVFIGDGYSEVPDTCRTWQDVMAYLKSNTASAESKNRNVLRTLSYGFKSIGEWILRGFKKM